MTGHRTTYSLCLRPVSFASVSNGRCGACEGGFRQRRHDDTGVGVSILIFKENCQETSERDTANKRSLEL